MCAAVNSLEANRKSKTFLCCTPCCFGPSPKNTTTQSNNDNNGYQKQKSPQLNPFQDDYDSSDFSNVKIDDVRLKTAPNSASFPSRQLVFSPESPSTSSCPPLSPQIPSQPAKLGFLVSFLVDARGGAMKGNRGSGMRLIIPPGIYSKYILYEICSKQRFD